MPPTADFCMRVRGSSKTHQPAGRKEGHNEEAGAVRFSPSPLSISAEVFGNLLRPAMAIDGHRAQTAYLWFGGQCVSMDGLHNLMQSGMAMDGHRRAQPIAADDSAVSID